MTQKQLNASAAIDRLHRDGTITATTLNGLRITITYKTFAGAHGYRVCDAIRRPKGHAIMSRDDVEEWFAGLTFED